MGKGRPRRYDNQTIPQSYICSTPPRVGNTQRDENVKKETPVVKERTPHCKSMMSPHTMGMEQLTYWFHCEGKHTQTSCIYVHCEYSKF